MLELLEFSLTAPNIVYTTLLIIILAYWLMVILGALDFGSFDVDFDVDADIDVDLDVDIDVDTDIDTDFETSANVGNGLIAVLKFFNFGSVPFMIIMSFVVLFSWLQSILLNYYISDGTMWFPIFMIIPILFVSLLLTKIITTPLVGLFKTLESEEDKEINFIGMKGEITIIPIDSMLGQLKVVVYDNPILLNVKILKEQPTTFKKGETATIVEYDVTQKIYFITKN